MKSAAEILHDLGINVQHTGEGAQSTTCPKCSHTRKKKRAKCLKVTIDHEGVMWYCHHCEDSGGVYYENGKDFKPKPKRKTLSMADMRGLRYAQ